MKFDENLHHKSGALSITFYSFITPHAYFLIDVQKSHFSSNFEKVPKSMKNVRFWSGFLHVILKLIPQQDPTGKNSYSTHRAKFEHCRPLFEATNPAVS